MAFRYLCVLVLWTKVASALEGLNRSSSIEGLETEALKKGYAPDVPFPPLLPAVTVHIECRLSYR